MPLFDKYNIVKVIERKDNAIYKTRKIGYEWFECGKGPECYVVDDNDVMYCATTDSLIAKSAPEKVIYGWDKV